MKKTVKRLLFWMPRILCIIFAANVILFAIYVSARDIEIWKPILISLMYEIPTGIVLVVLVISLYLEWVGGILFYALGVFYLVRCRWCDWPEYLIVSGFLFLLSVLFLINWLYKTELRLNSQPLALSSNTRFKGKRKVAIGNLIGVIVLVFFFFAIFKSLVLNELRPRPPIRVAYEVVIVPEPPYLSSIDRILESLELGNIAFNYPESMNIYDTSIIQLVLGVGTPIDKLKQMVKAEGKKVGAEIQITNRMEASLSGFAFTITAISPEVQAISRNQVTEWKWEIRPPRFPGHFHLHLTLTAFLIVEGESTPRAIRTFDKIIEVEVTWVQRTAAFLKNNWQWLWAAILIPVGCWLWKKRKERSKAGVNKAGS